ncbi:MAG: PAS domain S-box protein [Lacunisphaera sp.]
MHTTPHSPEARGFKIAGWLLVAIAGSVIAGWVTNARFLVSFMPGDAVIMVFNTALCALGSGAGFGLLAAGRTHGARLAGLFVAWLSAMVLLQYLSGRALGIDELFWPHQYVNRLASPGRMSANTALGFLLTSLALLELTRSRVRPWVLSVVAGLVSAVALIPLVLHVATLLEGYTNAAYQGMSFPTALSLLVVAGALVICRPAPERGGSWSLQLITAAAGMLVSVGLMTVQSHSSLAEANRWVVRTYEVQSTLDNLVAEVARMESSARAYALTADDNFLTRRTYHQSQIRRALDTLGRLMGDNPQRTGHVARLRELAEQKLAQGERLVLVRQGEDVVAAARYLGSLPTQETSALVKLVDVMQAEERRLLAERNEALAIVERNTRLVQVLGSLLAVVFISLALASALRSAAARLAAKEELREANASLERRVRERTLQLQAAHDEVVGRERSLRFMADTMPQLVWTVRPGPAGSIETFNRGWEDYTGLSEAQSARDGWLAAVHPSDLPATLELWRQTKETKTGRGGEYRLRRARDGAYRWHLWQARPERDADGQVLGWVGTSTDIHDQKEAAGLLERTVQERTAELAAAKQELEGTNRLQRAVLDGAQFGIVSVATDGIITTFSRGAEKMLGYTHAETVGRLSLAALHVEAELAARTAELATMTGNKSLSGFEALVARARRGDSDEREWTYLRRDGSRVPVRVSLTALRDVDDTITGFLAVVQDLSAERSMEVALRRSEDRLQHVLGQADCLVWEAHVRITTEDWDWRFTIHPSGMFHRLFGERRKQAGLWYQFDIPEQEEMNARSREAMLSGAPGYAQEFRVIKDGIAIWIRESVSIIRTDPQHCWLVGVATDITRFPRGDRPPGGKRTALPQRLRFRRHRHGAGRPSTAAGCGSTASCAACWAIRRPS